MENKDAIRALAALAQETRLNLFRLLVRHAPDGLTPGVIGERLGIPLPTLSFHLRTLAQAGLVVALPEGRHLRYRAQIAALRAVQDFLTEDCCGGDLHACQPED